MAARCDHAEHLLSLKAFGNSNLVKATGRANGDGIDRPAMPSRPSAGLADELSAKAGLTCDSFDLAFAVKLPIRALEP
jgi:hypothetical protein